VKILVFHYTPNGVLPQLTPELGAAVKEGITREVAANPSVKYLGTEYDPATGKAICSWEAPDAATVAQIFDRLKIPYDEAVAVQPLVL
jgi:hypothetical protein